MNAWMLAIVLGFSAVARDASAQAANEPPEGQAVDFLLERDPIESDTSPRLTKQAPGEHYMLTDWDSWQIDQDLFAGSFNEDRNYTMGLAFNFRDDKARLHRLYAGRALGAVDALIGVDHVEPAELVTVGISAFTPDRLDLSEPILDDRPYSSIVFANTSRSTVIDLPRGYLSYNSSLSMGALGLPLAEWGQTAIHWINREVCNGRGGDDRTCTTPYAPKGWRNQISDGLEPTAMYKLGVAMAPRLYALGDVTLDADASVGYYTMASAGAMVRFGYVNFGDRPWHGPLPRENVDPPSNFWRGADGVWQGQAYFLLSGRVTLVGYNALLQGQFRGKNAVELDADEIERTLFEGRIGMVFRGPSGRSVSYTCTRRSPEHKLALARWHTWCGVVYETSRFPPSRFKGFLSDLADRLTP